MWNSNMAKISNSVIQKMIYVENFRGDVCPKLLPTQVFRDDHRFSSSLLKNEKFPFWFVLKNTVLQPMITSKVAFEKLERTDISRLCLKKTASGKYVLLRVIENCIDSIGWQTVVEDHAGNACKFKVDNYPPQELFYPGTVLIVKEPFFKIRPDGIYFIFCNCPTDILALRPSHPMFHLAKSIEWDNELRGDAVDPLAVRPVPSSALKWKERGNIYFDKNQLILAREAYFFGLELCKDEENSMNIAKILKLNLLAVHLELGYFEKAIKLGKEILDKFPDEKKALFRLGKAYYAARKFEEAFQTYERFCQKFSKEKEGIKEFERARERLKERNGEINIEKLRRLAVQNPVKEIDCADYDGHIEIKEIPGKGRGLVLTKNVKKGSVLMVSKALVSALNPRDLTDEHGDEPFQFDMSRVFINLTHMIYKNPNLFGPPVLSLHMGPHVAREPVQLFCDPTLKQEPICEMKKIKAVCQYNNFRILNAWNGGGNGTGLFILPSYMNHSCEFNVGYKFYNDVMVCTAEADLKAGTELTISYVDDNWSEERRSSILDERGFKCQCNKCAPKN